MTKFQQFITVFVKIVSSINAMQIFCAKIYDKNSVIDCKLIAYVLNNIVYNALYDK